jgi:hypothetical protein
LLPHLLTRQLRFGYWFEFFAILLQVWDVETGKTIGNRSVGSLSVRSIAQSFSGNLIAYTINAGAMTDTRPVLSIADLRDSDQMQDKGGSGQATMDVNANCCIFSHLDDTVVVGKLHFFDLVYTVRFRRKDRFSVPV